MAKGPPDPDDIFAAWTERFVPLWGPFYALFYILRLFWYELFKREE